MSVCSRTSFSSPVQNERQFPLTLATQSWLAASMVTPGAPKDAEQSTRAGASCAGIDHLSSVLSANHSELCAQWEGSNATHPSALPV